MSLIHDALKRARQQSEKSPVKMPLVSPVNPIGSREREKWILPTVVIFLITAAGFLIGLAFAHRTVTNVVVSAPTATPAISTSAQPVAAVLISPSNPPATTETMTNVANKIVVIATVPKLQGIFYDPTHPAAIVNGKTVYAGDTIDKYRVKTISKFTIILASPDGTEQTIHLGQ